MTNTGRSDKNPLIRTSLFESFYHGCLGGVDTVFFYVFACFVVFAACLRAPSLMHHRLPFCLSFPVASSLLLQGLEGSEELLAALLW